MKPVNILWDFDGTVYNTYPRILAAFEAVINHKYHLNVAPERLEDLVFVDTKHCVRVVADEAGMDFAALLAEVRTEYETHGEEETVFPEVRSLLSQWSGTRHFLVTNRERESLLRRLEPTGLTDTFEAIVAGDDGLAHKPDPAMFNHVIDEYRLDKAATVAVGDRDIDVQAGRSAGVRTLLISRRSVAGATVRIDDHAALRSTLEALATRGRLL